ncbi:hypothetical protein BV898_14264, partial [Hypsibius exemplaris]
TGKEAVKGDLHILRLPQLLAGGSPEEDLEIHPRMPHHEKSPQVPQLVSAVRDLYKSRQQFHPAVEHTKPNHSHSQ